jgi:hypothetical protein
MRTCLLVLAFSLAGLASYSQSLKGIVYDNSTRKPLEYAAVFINGSTEGTYTDRSGNFTLKINSGVRLPVAVSAIGYQSVLLTEYSPDQFLRIFLTPKTYELSEIVVDYKRTETEKRVRKENLTVFRKQFLGDNFNSSLCSIENEDDIKFRNSEGNDTLIAEARNPISINNKALGYKIIYHLEAFKYSRSKNYLQMFGIYSFIADSTLSGSQKYKVEKRRSQAYTGSRMHFFRALWSNELKSQRFIIRNKGNEYITADSLVITADSVTKYLKKTSSVYLMHEYKMTRTRIDIIRDSVYFNEYGYFDPFGIFWTGDMAKQRIADLLPYDYVDK